MPFNQSGDDASASFQGAYNDISGNQYNYYNRSKSPHSHREAIRQILKQLHPSDMDASHREECLAGTRIDVIDFIIGWVNETGSKRSHNVILLHGLAGSGKSTLSTTIANRLHFMDRLAAFVFFDRDVSIRSDPSTVIRTLAYKLGVTYPKVGEAIAANISKYPEIIHFSLRLQFEHLLVQPMTSCDAIDPDSPVVFVLDALDECGNPDTRRKLLDILAEQSSRLPVLFVITSRPLHDISGFFEDRDHVLAQELDITTQNNHDDISTFLTQSMRRIRKNHTSLRRRKNWPGDEKLEKLLCKASGLFIWASTACKFIDIYDPDAHLEMIVAGPSAHTAEQALDTLYRTALEISGRWDIPAFIADFRAVLGFILSARRPLTGDSIITLLGNSVTKGCIDIFSRFRSVLQLQPTVQILHPSFADFLFNAQRCVKPQWLFVESVLHHSMAIICIEHLAGVLKENFCNITLSPDPVQGDIPEDVAYACMYWIDHVRMEGECSMMIPFLEDFFRRHFLHWVEALSIMKMSRNTIESLQGLYNWLCMQAVVPTELLNLVNDGVRFVQRHAELIEAHPLHVYASALLFTPPDTLLYRTFHDPLVHPTSWGLVEQAWSPLLQVLSGHRMAASSVAYSADGTRIVSGSYDKIARVWDINSGMEALPPITAHTSYISSVAFSPDGTRIASGSEDHTIRCWDASSGAEVLSPMRGHTAWVTSVVFSPNGKFIISGSDDTNVRMWDARSGAEVRTPLQGHTEKIFSVSCSQIRIASGSADRTIRVWDIASGLEAIPPLKGHNYGVSSVSFSPNGSLIASGSWDETIRLWDAHSGDQILHPFEGHSKGVRSVAFSPDGTCIISGSDDNTIRVWRVTTGVEMIPPLVYICSIWSAAFSPDGTRIVSGAFDGTVQVWGATPGGFISPSKGHTASENSISFVRNGTQIGTQIAFSSDYKIVGVRDTASSVRLLSPLRGHNEEVRSVAFSPDGTRIASGSYDETVNIWDATTGLQVLPPLQHSNPVRSAAFSVDGSFIVSKDIDDVRYGWDAVSGTRIDALGKADPTDLMTGRNEIYLHERSRWITDRITGKYLCKVPYSVHIYLVHQCSYGRSLAVGQHSGNVFVIHFPPRA